MEGIHKYCLKKRDLSDQSQGDNERKKQGKVVLLAIPIFLVKDWSGLIGGYFI